MGIKILDVKINDLDYIIELNQNSKPAVSDMDMKSAEYFFKNSEYFKILKFDNNLIGFLNALSDDSDYSSVNYQRIFCILNIFIMDTFSMDTHLFSY